VRALELADASGSLFSRGTALYSKGWAELVSERPFDAEADFAEARTLFGEIGNTAREASAQMMVGRAVFGQGDLPRAEKLLRDAVRTLKGIDDRGSLCEAQRALAMVLAGERVAARGFVQHSLARQASDAGDGHPFVAMLHEASVAANTSTTVVAAVLALQRTGSNFLHDMIGLSVSAGVRNFHEHDVPGLAEAAGRPRPTVDPRLLERDGRYTLRQAVLRDTILTPQRRYIFVSDRSPEDRLLSYFVKGRSDWLHQRFDAARNRFREAAEIQRRFDEWAWAQLDRQRKWYRNKLLRPFGLNVLEAERIDGLLIGRHAANTLIVVPTARLNRLVEVVADAFRTDCYRALAHNSAKESGDEAIGRAFRQQFTIDPEVAESLWAIPEVAHIHGAQMLPLAARHRTFTPAIRRREAPARGRLASPAGPALHRPRPR